MPAAPPPSAAEVRAHVETLVARGVIVVDPARTWVEPTVVVDAGATLWPDSYLRGTTRVAAGAVIEPGCWIVDSEIGPEATIKAHSVCEGAIVGPSAAVGPMAHLRSGTVLEADVKIGNFVETKKAVLRRGAKASHLTYLGDAEVGADANVGAGTITCNYDGFGKYRTEIGAGAFIGSNSALVAPVRVGVGAIVGAGSVITKDVPDESLAFERSPQQTLEGKAPRIRERNKAKAKATRG